MRKSREERKKSETGERNAEWGLRPEGVGQKEESSRDYGVLWV